MTANGPPPRGARRSPATAACHATHTHSAVPNPLTPRVKQGARCSRCTHSVHPTNHNPPRVTPQQIGNRHVSPTSLHTARLPAHLPGLPAHPTRASRPQHRPNELQRVPAGPPYTRARLRERRALRPPIRSRHVSSRMVYCTIASPRGPRSMRRPICDCHVSRPAVHGSPMHQHTPETSESPFFGIRTQKNTSSRFPSFFHAESKYGLRFAQFRF